MMTFLPCRVSRLLVVAGSKSRHCRHCRHQPQPLALISRRAFTEKSPSPAEHHEIPPPTNQQLQSVMVYSALPMMGFGIMDQTIMIHAGNAIDCTIGVTLGLSTLAAAAVGQIVANAGGILFGETLQHFLTTRFSLLPPSNLSGAQSSLAVVARAKLAGTFWGLIVGCTLGLLNLLLIDTERSSNLKMMHTLNSSDEDKDLFAFEIHISNQDYHPHGSSSSSSSSSSPSTATILTVRGPDVDGILATMVTTLTDEGCSLVELTARPKVITTTAAESEDKKANNHNQQQQVFEDVFVVKRKGEAIPEAELDGLANRLWEAIKSPLNVPTLTAKVREMELKNTELEKRIENLQEEIKKRQVHSPHPE